MSLTRLSAYNSQRVAGSGPASRADRAAEAIRMLYSSPNRPSQGSTTALCTPLPSCAHSASYNWRASGGSSDSRSMPPSCRGQALGSKVIPDGLAEVRWEAKLTSLRPKLALPKS